MTRDNKLINGTIKGKWDTAKLLRVEAWLAGTKQGEPYAITGVDENGRFSLNLSPQETLKPGDRFYFKVFDDSRQLVDTSRSHLWYYEQENPPLEIEVQDSQSAPGNDAPPAKTQTVTGRIMTAEGQPVTGVQAHLFQRSTAGEKLLAKSNVGDNGRYQIEVEPAKQPRDFIVRIFDKNKQLGESDPCVEMAQTVTINVVVGDEPYRGPAEYDRLRERLAPYLEDGTKLADVDNVGIEFLACKSGVPIRYIRRAVRAAQLAKGSSFHPALLYGMFRVGIPGDARRLLRQEPGRIRQAAQAAIDQHLISQTLQPELAKIEPNFIDLAANAYLNPELAPDNGRLNGLLNLVGLAATQKSKIVTQRLTHQGSMDKYWDTLRQDKEIGEKAVAEIKLANQVDQLTGHHAPLTEALFARVRGDTKRGIQPLARWSQEEWLSQLEQSGVPASTPGNSAKIKRQNYSKAMMNVLETAFPTTALGARLAQSNLPQASKIGEFTQNYPDFEFRQQRLDSYLSDNPDIKLDDDTLKVLKGVERLAKITPDTNKASYVAPLLHDNLSSAHKIQQLGQGEFLRRYSNDMGQKEATAVYQSAAFSAGLTHQLFMGYGPPARSAVLPMVADQGAMMQTEVPEWAQMFGSLDTCSCEHCESVYSPAAYLVDILQFLNDRGALAALEAKRPDIGEIKLNCENANTLMPYIDLVNEILEQAVITSAANNGAPDLKPTTTWPHDTTLEAQTLRVQPEHLKQDAYDLLRTETAVYPFNLPFDLWQAEADTYLGQLDVARHTLMQYFSQNPANRQVDIAAAQLGISTPTQLKYIADARANFKLAWGYPDGFRERTMYTELANVDFLLQKTGISYDELLLLLAQPVININNDLEILFAAADPCDLTLANIQNVNRNILNRIHSFLRLRLVLGWTIPELGHASDVLNSNTIDEALIIKLAHFATIREQLDHPIAELLACWGTINTRSYEGENSLYDQLFLNRSVTNDPAIEDIFGLNADRNELANTSQSLTENSGHIIAALGIDEDAFTQLIAVLNLSDTLTLVNLSTLYRHALVADGLDLSIDDYLILWQFTEENIFDTADLGNMLGFMDTAVLLSEDAIDIGEVDYLLNHSDPNGDYAPANSEIIAALEAIRTELYSQSAAEAEQLAAERLHEIVIQQLATTLDTPLDTLTLLMSNAALNPVNSSLLMSAAFLSIAPDLNDPAAPEPPEITEANYADLFALFRYLDKLTTVLLHFGFTAVADADWLLANGAEHGWLDLTDPATLPLTTTQPDAEIFERWLAMVRMSALREAFAAEEPTFLILFAHIANEDEDQFVNDVLKRTGWQEKHWRFLCTQFGYTFPGSYAKGELINILAHLAACFDLIAQLGVSAEKVWAWANDDLSFAQALDIKQTVRAQYDEETWLSIAEPLRDDLREQQRRAMVGHTIQVTPNVENENQLFGYLLIDVEMAACMQTSRIKQALSSVQLFIQRCFLNLEPSVQFDATDAAQWDWMRRYRVWEANRKIFLYPENWIEPELRDDKTPIFAEVEAFLLQDEITMQRAEEAFRLYLEKLDQVAALDIVGLYHELESETNVLHIIGRTPAMPHVYFYRQLINETEWTPWDEIEVEIEGDHVLPVIYNRRLYLFWLTIADKEPKEIKLVWSQFWNGKWEPKSLSSFYVSNSNVNYISHLRILSTQVDNNLIIDCYYLPNTFQGDADHIGQFIFDGCTMDPSQGSGIQDTIFIFPKATFFDHQKYVGYPLAWWSSSAYFEPPAGTSFRDLTISAGSENYLTLLKKFESNYFVQPSRQFPQFLSQAPYAFWDNRHRFLVFPSPGTLPLTPYEVPPPVDDDPPDDTPIDPPGGYLPPDGDIFFPYPIEELDLFRPGEMETLTLDSGFGGNGGGLISSFSLAKTAVNAPKNKALTNVAMQQGGLYGQTINGRYQTQTWQNATLAASAGALGGLNLYNDSFTLQLFVQGRYHRFVTFYHPYVCLFQKELARLGVDGVLNPPIANPTAGLVSEGELLLRQKNNMGDDAFIDAYDPTLSNVKEAYPQFEITFNHIDAYAQYNWELFFHIPFFIANHLNQNQQFAEAQKWYHYIFDPTNTDSKKIAAGAGSANVLDPARFWKIRPFYENDSGTTIQKMMLLLAGYEDPNATVTAAEISTLIETWRNDPFDPHAIARFRISAYQKAIVLKYVDNLIDWGDSLFAQDTIESINEATQLYLLADAILGERPRTISKNNEQDRTINGQLVETYNDLEPHLDEFSNALIEIENLVTFTYPANGSTTMPSTLGSSLFFCIPGNETMLAYWDRVADRLFKIRNCMNIEGVVRTLALYQPPIDPALLVKAAAAGLDLGTVLSDLALPLPNYRFSYMVQKAAQFCNDVQGLGNALQAALEKQDAEELALLRAGHEKQILKAVKAIRQQQIDEAEEALNALIASKETAEYRRDYYKNLERRIPAEQTQIKKLKDSKKPQANAVGSQFVGATAALIPNVGVSGVGPYSSWGGSQLAGYASAMGGWYQFKSSIRNLESSLAGINAGYHRRADEWKHQETLATKEIKQLEKQIIAAQIRLAIAEQELATHEQQIANAEAVETVMKDKFTNEALYSWMVSQLSSIYFQSYQMAYDLAKKAQKAFQHELGKYSASYISFGYWDSLRKGLLAGDMLLHDLRRMENAYLDENKREMELTKHISLAQIAPEALLQLRATGTCFINIPEGLFDLDYPGHYMRRIKSVSLTIPGITGPYTSINCTLTLSGNRIRLNTDTTGGYAWSGDINDSRFQYDLLANQSIATSSGVNDSGLFELNFRDDRYLPFEGAGVVSNWEVKLGNPAFAQFDFNTISDVIFHMNYTARRDDSLRTTVETELSTALTAMLAESGELVQMISLRSLFVDEWARLLAADLAEGETYALVLNITSDLFPMLASQNTINISDVTIWNSNQAIATGTWAPAASPENSGSAAFTLGADIVSQLGAESDDLIILCTYSISVSNSSA